MKTLTPSSLAAIVFALSPPTFGQAHNPHGMAATPPGLVAAAAPASAPALGDGLVKKVNPAKGTVTLAHGALPNGMPPMTMAYKVKDKAWLNQLAPGQKIRFATDPTDGGMTVTHIERVQ